MPSKHKLQKEPLIEKLEEAVNAPPKIEITQKPKLIIPQIPAKSIVQAVPVMPNVPATPTIPVLDRITKIFMDPSVQVLNCPGSDKKILIARMGLVQATQISFSEQEIKELMAELSTRTRIPFKSGLVKLIYQNLIITAVISEFVGTKFVVERRQQVIHVPPRMPLR